MSERAEALAGAYRQLAASEAGRHLIAWIQDTADEKRRTASRSEPTQAWGELRLADGHEAVLQHIQQMSGLEAIGKKR